MKRIFTTSIAILGIVLWMGVSGNLSAQQKEPVLIGAIQDLTGPIGPHGQESLHATELAIEEINRAGGVDPAASWSELVETFLADWRRYC